MAFELLKNEKPVPNKVQKTIKTAFAHTIVAELASSHVNQKVKLFTNGKFYLIRDFNLIIRIRFVCRLCFLNNR